EPLLGARPCAARDRGGTRGRRSRAHRPRPGDDRRAAAAGPLETHASRSGTMRALGLVLGLCLPLAACGYNAGLRVTEHHDSVGVELFGNETYERDLEPE